MNMPGGYKQAEPVIILEILIKHYKVLAGVVVLSFLGTLLFTSSWVITPKYKSETIVYVPLTKISEQLIFTGYRFANDKETDEFIQILQSHSIIDSLDVKFHLGEHYGLTKETPLYREKLREALNNNTDISKTRYGSIAVGIKDEDPQLAADLANQMVRLGDVIKENLYRANNSRAFQVADEFYSEKVKEIEGMKSTLLKEENSDYSAALDQVRQNLKSSTMRSEGIKSKMDMIRRKSGSYAPHKQMDMLTAEVFKLEQRVAADDARVKEYLQHLPSGDTLLVKALGALESSKMALREAKLQSEQLLEPSLTYEALQKELERELIILRQYEREEAKILASFNPQFPNVNAEQTKKQMQLELEELIERKSYYEKTRQHLANVVPKVYVINKAEASIKNKYPNRLLIGILGTGGALFLTFFAYLGIYFLKGRI